MKFGVLQNFSTKVLVLIAVQLLAYLILLMQNRLIVDLLSTDFLGQLVVIGSYSGVMVTVFTLGWPHILLRDVALLAKSDADEANSIPYLLRQSTIVTQGALVIFTLGTFGLSVLLNWELPVEFWFACAATSIAMLLSLFASIVEGAGKVLTSRICRGVLKPLVLIVAILAAWGVGSDYPIGAYFAAQLIFLGLFVFVLWRTCGALLLSKYNEAQKPDFFPFGRENIWVLAISSFNTLILSSDVIVLQLFEESSVLGNYGLVIALMSVVAIGMGAANSLFLPGFGAALQENNYAEARFLFKTSVRISTLWSAFSVVLLFGAIQYAPSLFGLDETFKHAGIVVIMIGSGYLVNAITGPVTNVLFVEKKTSFIGLSLLFACGINLVGNFILVPVWGVLGAAISTAVSTCLIHVVQRLYAQFFSPLFARELKWKRQNAF